MKHIWHILKILYDHQLYLNLRKYTFVLEDVEFLSHIVSYGQVKMHYKKVIIIDDSPILKDLWAKIILRPCKLLLKVYLTFIMNCNPLKRLIMKYKLWTWTKKMSRCIWWALSSHDRWVYPLIVWIHLSLWGAH